MKGLICVLALMLAAPVSAQSIADAARTEARALADQHHHPPIVGHWEDEPIKSPTLVWVGLGLAAIGTVAAIAALTFAQQSDTHLEAPTTRLGRDLAPCGTNQDETTKPIADCKPHTALLVTGLAMQGTGIGLILYGARPMHTPADPSPAVGIAWRVRF